jgi:hypothetical protein
MSSSEGGTDGGEDAINGCGQRAIDSAARGELVAASAELPGDGGDVD